MLNSSSRLRAASLLAVTFTLSCASMKSSLADRATFDLGCPVAEADITEIVSGQYGVSACGCKATYVSYPSWTLNAVSGETCKATGPNPASAVPSASASPLAPSASASP